MKNRTIRYFLLAAAAFLTLAACNEATETTPKYKENLLGTDKTPAYYEALRAYKKTDHQIAFGWYGNWTGIGASLANAMTGLPDSVDVIAIWSGWNHPTPEMIKDLRYVQQVKGTRAMITCIVYDLGAGIDIPAADNVNEASRKAYWGWVDGDETAIEGAMRKYARACLDTVAKYDYDGFDIDWEPNGTSKIIPYLKYFIDELSKKLGPESGTGKLLAIDGDVAHYAIPSEYVTKFNYLIAQAYTSYGSADLDNRLNILIDKYQGAIPLEQLIKKFVVCENFESYAQTGGVTFYQEDGTRIQSFEGMAGWQPKVNGKRYRKGGAGTYHMEYEYTVSEKQGTYPFLRSAIQIMNPNLNR